MASCTGYALLAKSYIQVIIVNGNTVAGAITLNINGRGAKPIYINNAASSATNYTLPAGSYLVYYNGTNYYFSTDGSIPGATGAISGVTSDPTSTNSSMAASAYLCNYLAAEKKVINIAVANWSSGTTTVNNVAYHTYTVGVTAILVARPIMYLSIDSLPTDAQEEAWSGLKMVANTSNRQLTFYIETVPTVALSVGVKGVV